MWSLWEAAHTRESSARWRVTETETSVLLSIICGQSSFHILPFGERARRERTFLTSLLNSSFLMAVPRSSSAQAVSASYIMGCISFLYYGLFQTTCLKLETEISLVLETFDHLKTPLTCYLILHHI